MLDLELYGDSVLYGLSAGLDLPGNYGFAFLAQPDSKRPSSIQLEDAWTEGLCVFVDMKLPAPGDPGAAPLVEHLIGLIGDLKLSSPIGLVWIRHASHGVQKSRKTFAHSFVPLAVQGSRVRTAELAFVHFGSYALGLAKGTPVSLDVDRIAFANLSLNAPTVFFATSSGEKFATIGPSVASAERTKDNSGASLSISGSSLGCWQFELTLEKDTGRNLPTDAELLKLGLVYVYRDSSKQDALESLFYPVLDTDDQALSLSATLDPLSVLDESRSHFRFPSTNGAAPVLPTYFRTNFGDPISLQPADETQLICCPTPASNGNYESVCVVPKGEFNISQEHTGEMRLLAGIAGVETLGFSSAPGGVLQFVPGQNAYLGSTGSVNGDNKRLRFAGTLESDWTTSWVGLKPGGMKSLTYYLQPNHSVFYRLASSFPWCALDLPLCRLDAPIPTGVYPLVPYAGVRERTGSTDLTSLRQDYFDPFEAVESLVLQPLRARWFEQFSSGGRGGTGTPKPAVYGVSPQGLVVGFSKDLTNWETLTFAAGENGTNMTWNWITGDFLRALRRPEFFIVMTQKALKSGCFQPAGADPLDAAGWSFDISPDDWTASTICILKFRSGTLAELVDDESAWSWPQASEGQATQEKLQEIIANARAHGTENYDYLLQHVIDNPDWHGVIFFNAKMSLKSLPQEFASLAAGIDPALFMVDHIGISMTPSTGLDEQGHPRYLPSSVFGFINYQSTQPISSAGTYAYQVQTLEVLFINSQTVKFSGSVALRLGELFGRAVDTSGGQTDIINLSGAAESHDGSLTVRFTSNDPIELQPLGSVIRHVTIGNAQLFNSNAPGQGGEGETRVTAVFLFDGSLATRNISEPGSGYNEQFDLFAFDELPFQQMRLELSFPLGDPTDVSYVFDPGHMTLSATGAVPRTSSLAQQLPLRIQNATSWVEAKTPAELGFTSLIVSPFNGPTKLNSPWYAIEYELDLGSQGALSTNKTFSIDLLVAWSPPASGDSADAIWIGMKVPGMDAHGDFFDFEDVVKLGAKEITLTKQPDGSFLITFVSVGLSVLGQTVPPGGQTNLLIFGDPSGPSRALAWFGAYVKQESSNSS